jgi:hypothetical protein
LGVFAMVVSSCSLFVDLGASPNRLAPRDDGGVLADAIARSDECSKPHTFCRNFDTDDLSGWTHRSPDAGGIGEPFLTTDGFVSAPRSLVISHPGGSVDLSSNVEVYATYPTENTVFGFDLWVDVLPTGTETPNFARLNLIASSVGILPAEDQFIYLRLDRNGGVNYRFFIPDAGGAGGGAGVSVGPLPLNDLGKLEPKTWYRFEVSIAPTAGGSTRTLGILVRPKPSMGNPPVTLQLPTTWRFANQVGMLLGTINDALAAPYRMQFDNAFFDAK